MKMKQNSELHLWENGGLPSDGGIFDVELWLWDSLAIVMVSLKSVLQLCIQTVLPDAGYIRLMFGSKLGCSHTHKLTGKLEETIKLILVLCNRFGYLCRFNFD